MPFSPAERKKQTHTHTHTSDVSAIGKKLGKLLQEAPFHSLSVLNLTHSCGERKRERESESKSKEVGAKNRKRRCEEKESRRLISTNTSYMDTCCCRKVRDGVNLNLTCCSLPHHVTPASRNKTHFILHFVAVFSCDIWVYFIPISAIVKNLVLASLRVSLVC